MYIAIMENSLEVAQKTKNRVIIWSSHPTPEPISGQNYNLKRCKHSYVHNSIHIAIHSGQGLEITEVSIDRWTDKEDTVNTHGGILLRHKKEGNDAICSNTNGSRDNGTKQSQSERERQIPYDITYMRNLKYDTNEQSFKTETGSQT